MVNMAVSDSLKNSASPMQLTLYATVQCHERSLFWMFTNLRSPKRCPTDNQIGKSNFPVK